MTEAWATTYLSTRVIGSGSSRDGAAVTGGLVRELESIESSAREGSYEVLLAARRLALRDGVEFTV